MENSVISVVTRDQSIKVKKINKEYFLVMYRPITHRVDNKYQVVILGRKLVENVH